jgi:DsbC/DsbD-like thiol-disulfide interchange protein
MNLHTTLQFAIVIAAPLLAPSAAGDEAAGEARLLPAGAAVEGADAGVQLELGDGWKTYWRTPGDSGVPPTFDWSGSGNLANAEILWPAPKRFHDSGMTFFGYADRVVFPVRIVARDPQRPVDLDLRVSFGVCKDICLPRSARLKLTIDPRAKDAQGAHDALIATHLARVPRPDDGGSAPRIVKAVIAHGGSGAVLRADIDTGGRSGVYLFAEADGMALGPSEPTATPADGVQRFEAKLSEEDAARLDGKSVVFTITSADGAREVSQPVSRESAVSGGRTP